MARSPFLMGFPPGVLSVSADGKFLVPPIGPSFRIDPMNRLIEIETTEIKPIEGERTYGLIERNMLEPKT